MQEEDRLAVGLPAVRAADKLNLQQTGEGAGESPAP